MEKRPSLLQPLDGLVWFKSEGLEQASFRHRGVDVWGTVSIQQSRNVCSWEVKRQEHNPKSRAEPITMGLSCY